MTVFEDTRAQYVLRKTPGQYEPEEGRKVHPWSPARDPEEFFQDIQKAAFAACPLADPSP